MTDLEQRLRDGFHGDATRARLVNSDAPPTPEARPLVVDEPRSRPVRWIAAAAAVVVLALVGALVLLDDDQNVDTVPPATEVPDPAGPVDVSTVGDGGRLAPGTYFIDPDRDPSTPLTVTFEITDEDWEQWIGATKITNGPHTLLSITTVTNLVRHGCTDHAEQDPAVGPSVDDLATALSQLAPFVETAAPSDVTFRGYEGKHLELTISEDMIEECTEAGLHSWIAPGLAGSFNGYNGPEPGLREEFWILDVDGTRLVIETETSPDASVEWIDERRAIMDSIEIHP